MIDRNGPFWGLQSLLLLVHESQLITVRLPCPWSPPGPGTGPELLLVRKSWLFPSSVIDRMQVRAVLALATYYNAMPPPSHGSGVYHHVSHLGIACFASKLGKRIGVFQPFLTTSPLPLPTPAYHSVLSAGCVYSIRVALEDRDQKKNILKLDRKEVAGVSDIGLATSSAEESSSPRLDWPP